MDFSKNQKAFGERFNAERKQRKLTADTLSELLHVNRKTIYEFDRGRITKVEHLIAISELFECDIEYLLGLQDERTKAQTDIKAFTGLSAAAIELLHDDQERYNSGFGISLEHVRRPYPMSKLTNCLLCSEEYAEIVDYINRVAVVDELVKKCNRSTAYRRFRKEYKQHIRYFGYTSAFNSLFPECIVVDHAADDIEKLTAELEQAAYSGAITINRYYKNTVHVEDLISIKGDRKGIEKKVRLFELFESVYSEEEQLKIIKWEISDLFNDVIKRFIKTEKKEDQMQRPV